ncbi:Smr/MutS family protein [Haloflavibacter putidus]|uniref:Smr/MutS family protein n=2 Tax=Haloflavibacter putidus TaxID=2576776 RepID=A0A507ZPI5_9FLAO|nr:Smr/MutS family protein [Haloflavibacter putidus]
MKKMIKVGDAVEVLDEAISGKVKFIDHNLISIETTDGFIMDFTEEQLILKPKKPLSIKQEDLLENLKAKRIKKENPKKSVKPSKKGTAPPMEVDLHIHNLVNSVKGMSNFDMLNIQLDTARSQIEFAIRKRIPKVVFIHGVGEGVLKTELETVLSRYDNLKFYEADFKKYGFGATEVYIFQNA